MIRVDITRDTEQDTAAGDGSQIDDIDMTRAFNPDPPLSTFPPGPRVATADGGIIDSDSVAVVNPENDGREYAVNLHEERFPARMVLNVALRAIIFDARRSLSEFVRSH